jgi:2-oxoglutarate ferredoxin oxidoreductase subunit delta
MSREKCRFQVIVLPEFCKGCALCLEVCPTGALVRDVKPGRLGVQQVHVDPDVRCTGCSACAQICPDAAIEIHRVPQKGPSRYPTVKANE